MLVKNIINCNSNDNFTHYIFYKQKGLLLDQIAVDKRKLLIQSKFENQLLFIINLRKIVKLKNIRIIHNHQPIDVVFSALATFGLNVKIIRTYHGFPGKNKSNFMGFLKYKILNIIANKTICLNIFVSFALLDHFRTLYPFQANQNQRVLYNGIDLKTFEYERSSGRIRRELNIKKKNLLVGMVGSFNTFGRDQYTVCRALKLTLAVHPSLHFIFIGRTSSKNPELFSKCFDYCRDNKMLNNVHFIGERIDIANLLPEMDLYVHSSKYETFGISLVEAMLAGVPCIASNIPAFHEISDNGRHITFFSYGDEIDLNRKIIDSINGLAILEQKRKSNEAKEFVRKNFSIQSHLANLHKYYQECLN